MSNRFQVMPSLLVQGPHWKHCPECLVPPGGDIHGSFPVHLMEFRLSMSLQVKKKKEKKKKKPMGGKGTENSRQTISQIMDSNRTPWGLILSCTGCVTNISESCKWEYNTHSTGLLRRLRED